ncbi:glycosyltransferase family 4 protein [Vitellibacter sp. q18]|nr:glycosyltransferase family 4 protein [Aequorivita lutea]
MQPKRNLLYIGNKLALHGGNPVGIDALAPRLEAMGFGVITASSKKNRALRMVDMVLVTLKNRKRASLVLIDTFSTWNFYYAVIVGRLCRLLNLPYIPILHGGNLPDRLKKSRKLSKKFFGNAVANVAPSQFIKQEFEASGFRNLYLIPNAIEIENYPFKKRENIAPKLLWVRSFSEIYNPWLAVEIVELLKKKGTEACLCMVGPDKDGSLERCKKMAADLQLPIRFPGRLTKSEWIALSAEFDIFINTTNFDNMPVSVMEAMALGLPVISTNVGGMLYLIENGVDGILLPPNSATSFVQAIEELCADPLKAQTLTKNARTKMETLDWEVIKHKWIKLLGE